MDYEAEAVKFLRDAGFNLEELLGTCGFSRQFDVLTVPPRGSLRQKYNRLKIEVRNIVANAIADYVRVYGAVLKQDIIDGVATEIISQQEKDFPHESVVVKVLGFFESFSDRVRFNEVAEARGLSYHYKWRRRFGQDGEFEVDRKSSGGFAHSTIYFVHEESVMPYLFDRFGKVRVCKKEKSGFEEGDLMHGSRILQVSSGSERWHISKARNYLLGKGVPHDIASEVIVGRELLGMPLVFEGMGSKRCHFYQCQLDEVISICREKGVLNDDDAWLE
ncbi:MAG: hypothetical protein ABIG28_01450 [archaeon]